MFIPNCCKTFSDMNQQKINNVLNLESKDRYGYLLRKVADFETIYLISDQNDGFVMIGSNDTNTLPVWPEKAFADLFLKDEWEKYKVVEFKIDEFIEWLDELKNQNVKIAGFPNLDLNTVHVSAEDMKNHLLFEISQYE